MRSDMDKVIVERPRISLRGCATYRERRRELDRLHHDDSPRREPIRRWATRGCAFDKEKLLAENLRPLARYLLKQVGRPWCEVHAELAARFDRNSAVQMHVWQHALAMVEQHAFHRGRELLFVCSSRELIRFGKGLRRGSEFPLTRRDSVAIVYVCPRSGLLKRVPDEQSNESESPR